MKPGVFSKVLSLNDTGETGAHMGGILVPKTETQIFPFLDPSIKNPRAQLSMKDRNGRSWQLSFIYYNNANFDGTRDEYRLTGLTEFIAGNGLAAGDTITVTRTNDGIYFLDFNKADPSANAAQPPQINLALTTDQSRDSSTVSHDHAMRPAEKHLAAAFKHPLTSLTKIQFIRAWCSLVYLYPGLHPDGFASRGSGWPKAFKPIAEEAWRRFEKGESGWRVVRIWEHDVQKRGEFCIRRIKALMDSVSS